MRPFETREPATVEFWRFSVWALPAAIVAAWLVLGPVQRAVWRVLLEWTS